MDETKVLNELSILSQKIYKVHKILYQNEQVSESLENPTLLDEIFNEIKLCHEGIDDIGKQVEKLK